jgi:hypothetical protein
LYSVSFWNDIAGSNTPPQRKKEEKRSEGNRDVKGKSYWLWKV